MYGVIPKEKNAIWGTRPPGGWTRGESVEAPLQKIWVWSGILEVAEAPRGFGGLSGENQV